MPSAATLKLIGYGIGALALIALLTVINGWRVQAHDRGEKLAVICQATRDASNLPKLRCSEVPAQIKFLGEALQAVRVKTEAAKAADTANKARVEGEQATISKQTEKSYADRIADARARAERLRPTASRADQGRGGTAPLPSVPSTAAVVAQIAEQDRFSLADRLTATEQAIQLDELIKWVKAQHAVQVNGAQR